MWGLRCAVVVSALHLGRSLAHSPACAEGQVELCDSPAADGPEDASLIQLKKSSGGQFPDLAKELSKAADYVNDVAGRVNSATKRASTAISEGAATALTALGDTLNRTLAVMATEAKVLQTRVNASKANITSGVASAIVLGKSLNAKAAQVPVDKNSVEELNSTLAATTKLWKTMDTAAVAAVDALGNGLRSAGLSDVAADLNSTMQAALGKATAFVNSLHGASAPLWSSSMEARAEEIVEKVNASLSIAGGYAEAFPKDFLDAFTRVKDGVLNATKGLLSTDLQDKVSVSFGGAQAQAEAAAQGLGSASTELIGGMEAGLSATRQAIRGAAARHTLTVWSVLLFSFVLSLPSVTAGA